MSIMIIQVLLFIFGLILLVKGADWLVEGASDLARKFNVSDLIIGLTIVAFGTSAPELVVNIFAQLKNHPDIVFGNIIGSNNFNIFVILGLAGVMSPLVVQSRTVWKEIPISFAAVLILLFLTNDFGAENQVLTGWEGVFLLALFILFLIYVYKQLKIERSKMFYNQKSKPAFKIGGLITFGLAGLVFGSRFLVSGSIEIAEYLGVSEKIIGLTIVAAGTSLPELATSIVAALKNKNDIAVGNIIGSNIFNIFLILGVCAIIRPIPFKSVFNGDLFLLSGGTIFLFIAMFTGQKRKLDRWEAATLIVTYIGYMVILLF